MLSQIDKEKLHRFNKGQTNDEDNQYIYRLFAENEESPEFKKVLLSSWNDFIDKDEEEDYGISFLLDRIHHIVRKNEHKKQQTAIKKFYLWYSAAAAILIPLLIVGGILFTKNYWGKSIQNEKSTTATIVAPLGSRINFSLPDGTNGWLNSGSSIEYSLPFNNNRKVKVLGEAWFNVTRDALHPFDAIAGSSKLSVLGTKFNLSAYPEDKYVEVVLEEGKVIFHMPGLSSNIEMKPGERLIYNNDSVQISETDPGKYSAWTEGKLVFRGDPMREVARRIERWYNVDVELLDKELEKYVIRGTFQDDSLEDVFRYLSMTSPLEYRIIDRKTSDDGTFQKKKVLLYKRKN